MEQLILLAIAALVSSFLKKGKGKQVDSKTSPSKPFMATGRVPERPQNKLKDLSKELYRELQKEVQRTDVEPPSRQLQMDPVRRAPKNVSKEPVVVAALTESRPSIQRMERLEDSRRSTRVSSRLLLKDNQTQDVILKQHDLMPKNKEDIIKGFIFSEIFGPPKSKR